MVGMDELERKAVEIGQELGRLRRLVARLAAVDPYGEGSGAHGASCYFCDDEPGDQHHSDCLWLQAKKEVRS